VEKLASALFLFMLMAFLTFIIWLGSRDTMARRQTAFEAQKLLLNKFQSAEELNRFLSTEAGKQFVERLGGTGDASALTANPRGALFVSIVFGAAGVALGLTFLVLMVLNKQPDMLYRGMAFSIPGAGLLAGGAYGYYQYYQNKKAGLLKRAPATPEV
jgi:hypothetical protein